MFLITFLLEMFLQLCFCIQDFIKIVRHLLAAASSIKQQRTNTKGFEQFIKDVSISVSGIKSIHDIV